MFVDLTKPTSDIILGKRERFSLLVHLLASSSHLCDDRGYQLHVYSLKYQRGPFGSLRDRPKLDITFDVRTYSHATNRSLLPILCLLLERHTFVFFFGSAIRHNRIIIGATGLCIQPVDHPNPLRFWANVKRNNFEKTIVSTGNCCRHHPANHLKRKSSK